MGFILSVTLETLPDKNVAKIEHTVKELEKEEVDTIVAKMGLTLNPIQDALFWGC